MAEALNDDQVRHVAKLSRLRLSDEEVHHFAGQLSAVLGYVSQLNELDVENVEPMAHAADVSNVLREDQPQLGMSVDSALANAPATAGPFFKTPKILGDDSGAWRSRRCPIPQVPNAIPESGCLSEWTQPRPHSLCRLSQLLPQLRWSSDFPSVDLVHRPRWEHGYRPTVNSTEAARSEGCHATQWNAMKDTWFSALGGLLRHYYRAAA